MQKKENATVNSANAQKNPIADVYPSKDVAAAKDVAVAKESVVVNSNQGHFLLDDFLRIG